MEARYAQRVAALADDPDALAEYMLDAMRYIQEYTLGPPPAPEDAPPAEPPPPPPPREAPPQGSLAHFLVRDPPTAEQGRRDTLRRYLEHVEGQDPPRAPPPAKPAPRRRRGAMTSAGLTCPRCSDHLLKDAREARLVCRGCGETTIDLEELTSNLTYSQLTSQMQFTTTFAYKPMNHFTEFLKQLQGKEDTEIPAEVLDAMRAEFRMARAKLQADITPDKVRVFLKKHGYTKLYDHRYKICMLLGGVPPPRLPEALESQLMSMFDDMQAPWKECKPPERKNFLAYNYVIYQSCRLLGEDEYLQHLTLLKNADKLYQHDLVWKKMCAKLGWEFIPTV
jgi:hypothetical protein